MIISIIALAVATLSLLWNIVSAIYTWKTAKPIMRIYGSWMGGTMPTQSGRTTTEWLRVAASNVGNAAASVTSIYVWKEYALAEKRKKRGMLGFGAEHVDDFDESISGPMLPYTIEPNHSGEWYFDLVAYLGYALAQGSEGHEKLLIEIGLGSGQIIQREINISERYPVIVDQYKSRARERTNSPDGPSDIQPT